MAKKASKKIDLADSAHRVWLAGLGALATAGTEGEKLFETLVSRGQDFEKRMDRPVKKASSRVRGTVTEVKSRAGKTFNTIQTSIDDTVSSALHRLGVPTRSEIDSLGKKVERLTRAVETRTLSRKKAVRKTTKRTAGKKGAKKKPKRAAKRSSR